MGKDLKGRELGKGLSQRKSDGLYTGRFVSKRNGKTIQKYFPKLQDCRQWYAEAIYQDEFGSIRAGENMTVDTWFDYWVTNIKASTIRYSTLKSYKDRYKNNICPVIGKLKLMEIKPLHCQEVLNKMDNGGYSSASIKRTKSVLKLMFCDAVDNYLITNTPMTSGVKLPKGKPTKSKESLTIEEQKKLLSVFPKSQYYNQFSLVLQTGLRRGELGGLRWCDVDFDKKILHIRRNIVYDQTKNDWIIGEPKTKSGMRDIPLTDEAIRILQNQKQKMKGLKIINVKYSDFVFLTRNGNLINLDSYNVALYRCCDRVEIPRVGIHVLRHTFATRCIEAGMRPKTLQVILGHSDIGITMNLYVHVTENEKQKEMDRIKDILKVV